MKLPEALDGRVQSAGVDLSARTIQWGQRGPVRSDARRTATAPITVTVRDVELCATLADFNYLTTSQVAALFWGRYTTPVKRRLKLLCDHGFLDKLRPAVSGGGSPEWIYRVAERGFELLRAEHRLPDERRDGPGQLYSIEYTAHDIQLAGIVIDLARRSASAQRDPQRPLLETAPFRMVGQHAGAIDPRREQAPDGQCARVPKGHEINPNSSREGLVLPDATIVGPAANGDGEIAILFEYDRTQRPSKQHHKYLHYDHFLAAGWRRSRYAPIGSEPAVIFVCATDEQADRFARDAHPLLTAWTGPTHGGGGTYPGREETAFTSRDRLLAGDWRMLQVPANPHGIARHPNEITLREIEMPIPELFAGDPRPRRGAPPGS